jgi:ATP-dependent DNA helicase RecG
MDRFNDLLDTIARPLQLARGNNFSRLPNIRGLGALVTHTVNEALSFSSPPTVRRRLQQLKGEFSGFDDAVLPLQQQKVHNGTILLNEIFDILQSDRSTAEYDHDMLTGLLETPIRFIKGVGPKIALLLKKKGIEQVEDALFTLPLRYEDRRTQQRIADLAVGERAVGSAEVLVAGEVTYPKSRRRVFEAVLGDTSGFITAKWFQGVPYIRTRLKKGDRVVFCGEVRGYRSRKELHHPDLEWIDNTDDAEADSLHFGRIVPVYSETEGLSQRRIRTIMHRVITEYAPKVTSPIPVEVTERCTLMPLPDAFREAHFPDLYDDVQLLNLQTSPAHQRLAFEEFFFLELGMALRQRDIMRESGIAFHTDDTPSATELLHILPFRLTAAQRRVVNEIQRDMANPHPMNRLLQGDVGSGKTVVALIASLIAVDNNYQAALMAPTEILAEQHYMTLSQWLKEHAVHPVLLTGSVKGAQRDGVYREIQEGTAQLVVGTHALIQDEVLFDRLGLAVIDEQHRFGVLQRARLKRKGTRPDLLVMTATPIPRTLAMTVYGDMDVSVLDEMPPGRLPITTVVYRERERQQIYRRIETELSQGRQAYVVYPLVEESERIDLRDATEGARHLQQEIFCQASVGLIHGRMKGEEKERIMHDFQHGDIQILVATTVIEVGIDTPNATVMVVEHAERFGLSQLHQLRGRIGRGPHPSWCLLCARGRLTKEAWRRLKVMEETTDGFRIAEEDLAIRGPGEFLGVRQWGIPDFRVANLIRDAQTLQDARREAFALIERDPRLDRPRHRPLAAILRQKWAEKLELANVG